MNTLEYRNQLVDWAAKDLRNWVGADGFREDAAQAMQVAPRFHGLDAELRDRVLAQFDPRREQVAHEDYLPCLDTDCGPDEPDGLAVGIHPVKRVCYQRARGIEREW